MRTESLGQWRRQRGVILHFRARTIYMKSSSCAMSDENKTSARFSTERACVGSGEQLYVLQWISVATCSRSAPVLFIGSRRPDYPRRKTSIIAARRYHTGPSVGTSARFLFFVLTIVRHGTTRVFILAARKLPRSTHPCRTSYSQPRHFGQEPLALESRCFGEAG